MVGEGALAYAFVGLPVWVLSAMGARRLRRMR